MQSCLLIHIFLLFLLLAMRKFVVSFTLSYKTIISHINLTNTFHKAAFKMSPNAPTPKPKQHSKIPYNNNNNNSSRQQQLIAVWDENRANENYIMSSCTENTLSVFHIKIQPTNIMVSTEEN